MSDKFEALEKTTKAAANAHTIGLSDDVSNLTKAELEERKKAVEGMDKELKEIYESEQKAYRDHKGDVIGFNYSRGSVAAEVRRNPKYGDAAISLLSTALGVDRSTMYKTIKFSYMYNTKGELDKVVKRAEDKGLTLTWSHFATVMHVPDSEEGADPHANRRNMIEMAIDNKLSVRALASEVKLTYGNNTAKKAASAKANVKSLFRQLLSANTRFTVKLKNNIDGLLNDFDEAVEAGSAEDVKEIVENTALLQESIHAIIDLSKRVKDWVDKFPSKITNIVSERKKISEMREEEASELKKKKIAR